MAIHSLFELPRTALVAGSSQGAGGGMTLGLAEVGADRSDFAQFDIIVNNTGAIFREAGNNRAENPGHHMAWQDQILGQFNLIAAPVEQLRHAGRTLAETEKKRLCNLIGRQAAKLMQLVSQLDPEPGAAKEQAESEIHPTPTVCAEIFPPAPAGRRRSAYDAELLQKLNHLLAENLEEPDFNVHKMCSQMHLSHMHFIRKVKQLTGKKPIDLLKTVRLKRAKELLLQEKLSVSEIAYKVGYDMPNSFSRAFKKEFGISPTAYTG